MKTGFKRYVLIGIILITIVSFSVSWSEQIATQRPKLIIGDDFNYPPYSFVDDSGNPSGFNIDLARSVADAMGYDVEFRLEVWNKVREDLENGQIDLIPGMFYTEDRSLLYDFSTKHSVSVGDIFTQGATKLNKLSDLAGKTVVVQKGDVIGEYLKALKIDIVLVEVPSVNASLRLVADGTYAYAGLLKIPGLYEIKNDAIEGVIAQNISFEPQDYCMAVKKGNDALLHTLNSGLNIVNSTGEYREIYDKWLGVYDDKTMAEWVRRTWIQIAVSSVIAIILLSALIFNVRKDKKREKELSVLTDKLRAKEHEIEDANMELDVTIEDLINAQDLLKTQYDRQGKNSEFEKR